MSIHKRGDCYQVRWRDKRGAQRARTCPTMEAARKVEDAVKNSKALDEDWGSGRRGKRRVPTTTLRRLKKANAELRKALLDSARFAGPASDDLIPPVLRPLAGMARHLPVIPITCGVYFLVSGAEVVYVGQSVDVMLRVANHAGDKFFDGAFFIPLDAQELDAVEGAFIRALRPQRNLDPGPPGDDAGVLARFGLEVPAASPRPRWSRQ